MKCKVFDTDISGLTEAQRKDRCSGCLEHTGGEECGWMEKKSEPEKQYEPVTIATIEDNDWIKKIYSESKSELGSFNLFYSWDNFISGKKGKFIVIKGRAFIRYDWSDKYKAWVIYDIGVLKEYRGQGIAAYLIQFVPVPILLKCNQDNEAGNKFYYKLGFTLSGTTETKKGNPQNIWTCAAW